MQSCTLWSLFFCLLHLLHGMYSVVSCPNDNQLVMYETHLVHHKLTLTVLSSCVTSPYFVTVYTVPSFHVNCTAQLEGNTHILTCKSPLFNSLVPGEYEVVTGQALGFFVKENDITEAPGLGTTGSPGSPGLPGPKGVKGSPGKQGKTGGTGGTGERGPTGIMGAKGATGTTGTTGGIGATGGMGATGATGRTGNTGNTGSPGATGPVANISKRTFASVTLLTPPVTEPKFLGLQYIIAAQGVFPSRANRRLLQVGDNLLGQILLVPYNFIPDGYLRCDGSLIHINQNTALFSLLGTNFGGDGTTTFALPDLRGAVPVSVGGIENIVLGQSIITTFPTTTITYATN